MDPPAMAFRLLRAAAGWAWVVAILGPAGSRTATVLLCRLVRRGRVTRFLFGLKPGEVPSTP
jgi:hypothetical protein